jgi:hypothetical protein
MVWFAVELAEALGPVLDGIVDRIDHVIGDTDD